MFRDNSLRCCGGWTIIDILVVVAVIAILAGILFPIFARARLMGYQTKCASNLQQLGAAFNTYSQDWVDYWPCPGGLTGDRSYWHQSGKGGLTGYIKQRGFKTIWCCPLTPEWKSYYPPRSYTMNSYLREPADIEYDYNFDGAGCTRILKGIRTSNIQRMGQTILVFEGIPLKMGWETMRYYVYIYRCCNWTGVKGCSTQIYPQYEIDPGNPWHSRYNNYLYADGHLQARQPGICVTGTLFSTHKEMYEWYIDKTKFERRWANGQYGKAPYE